MKYRIESIDLYIRKLPPDRIGFSIGKLKVPRRPSAVGLCRLILRTDDGRTVTGCSGDRPSYGWLDKRKEIEPLTKLRSLIELVHTARDAWLEKPAFDSVFEHWFDRHRTIMAMGKSTGAEALSSSYASAMIERAAVDAVCRAEGRTVFESIQQGMIGDRTGLVHSELAGLDFASVLPARPQTRFWIRHTVGLTDPLTAGDLESRVGDGEPETLEEYAARDGLRFFKVKISGDADRDLERLMRIWEVIPKTTETAITMDGNEAFEDLGKFAAFVDRLEMEAPGLFQHTLFIEQPLTRQLTHDPESAKWIARISEKKPLVIDEADGTLDAFKSAHEIGYAGTSHKNCKGFFKSLLNHALGKHLERQGKWAFLSGEDLSNMPVVPLHQDFAALGILGLHHCERNGHHYAYGAGHLTVAEKAQLLRDHPDLYVERGEGERREVFLNIVDGRVECGSLQVPGFGVKALPDWASMEPMQTWLDANFPAE